MRTKRHAAIAQIESDDVEAVSVFITGDKDNSARKAKIEDLTVFASMDETETAGSIQRSMRNFGKENARHTIRGLPHLVELVG